MLLFAYELFFLFLYWVWVAFGRQIKGFKLMKENIISLQSLVSNFMYSFHHIPFHIVIWIQCDELLTTILSLVKHNVSFILFDRIYELLANASSLFSINFIVITFLSNQKAKIPNELFLQAFCCCSLYLPFHFALLNSFLVCCCSFYYFTTDYKRILLIEWNTISFER